MCVCLGCCPFVSFPRCLLPSPYQCLCGSTYCTTFLWISFFMCNSHQPHHANKGKRVWKKWLSYYLSFLVMNVPSSATFVWLSLSAVEWLWFVLTLITIKETYLKGLKGRFKSYEKDACCKCGFTINSPSPLCLYIKVLNQSWQTQGKWHKPILSTSVSLWSFYPNKETQLNSEQLSSLIFLSPEREHCSLCLCPQLDSTPWVCKLIKKLGGTISLTGWRAKMSLWCAWYSMGLHYDYNNPPFFPLTHTHTSSAQSWDHTGNFHRVLFFSLVQREICEECALNFKVGGLIVFFIKAAV